MKLVILLLLLTCFTKSGIGQSSLFTGQTGIYVGFYDRKECKRKIKRELHPCDTCFYKNAGDTLKAFFKSNERKGIIALMFGDTDDSFGNDFCTRQEMVLDCADCSEKDVEALLHSRSYGWRKIDNTSYVSKYDVHTQLKIVNDNAAPYTLKLLFTYIDMPTKDFKEWYITLPKPD